MKKILVFLLSLTMISNATSTSFSTNQLQTLLTQKRILDPSITFDKQKLDDFALKQGYGYKTGNLEELKNVLKEIKGFNTAVPEFVAISSDKIQNFLKSKQIDIADLWKKKIVPLEKDKESTSFKEKLYSALKENIETQISQRFSQLAQTNSDELQGIFRESFNSEEYNVYEMLEKFNKEGASLMIRSTGKEDTDSIANAGGNESIANVLATLAAVLKAMGVGHDENQLGVVSSYFGEKSFSQRLMVQDPELFEKPITPVLIQKMIGEQAGGAADPDNIPRVGVMFTEDADGGIYKKTKETTGETTGITIIQASYGHNEGVVNSRVPVDTYLVDDNGNTYSVLRTKRKRLCPHNNSEKKDPFEELKNPGQLPSKPALNTKTILKLKIIAKVLEEYYKKPMDVEFVYFPATDTLYIVQARPITYKDDLPDPCYLAHPEAIAEEKKVATTTIGSAGGSLRHVKPQYPAIVKDNIREALAEYSDLTEKQQKSISCIIIGEHAPALSHEATTLRGEGKPVVYTKDLKTIKQWIKNSQYNILVDVQQEIIVNNQENKKLSILDGWISYPLSKLVSLSENNAQTITLPVKDSAVKECKKLFTIMKKQKLNDAKKALGQLCKVVRMKSEQYTKQDRKNQQTLERLNRLNEAFVNTAETVAKVLEVYPENDLRRLFHIHFLETLFYQQPKSGEILHGDSYTYLFDDIARENKLFEKHDGINTDVLELFKGSHFVLSPELEKQWERFVSSLDDELIPSVKNMILFLAKQGLMSLWLNVSFSQMFEPESKTNDVAQLLLKEFNDSREFLERLHEKQEDLKNYNVSIWEKPKAFEKNLQAFEEKFLNFFISDEFLDFFVDEEDSFENTEELIKYFSYIGKKGNYLFEDKFKKEELGKSIIEEGFLRNIFKDKKHLKKSTSNLEKLAALDAMVTFVDFFDHIIKTLKGCRKYGSNKTVHFKKLLKKYNDLLNAWIVKFLGKKPQKMFSCGWGTSKTQVKRRIKSIRDVLTISLTQEDKIEDNLKPSKNFSVFSAALGSPNWMGMPDSSGKPKSSSGGQTPFPKTLEDVFTMIHQSLLNITNFLMEKKCNISGVKLPETIDRVKKMFDSLEVPSYSKGGKKPPVKPKLLGVTFQNNKIKFLYNIPLYHHSIQINLSFDKNEQESELTFKFFGTLSSENRIKKLPDHAETMKEEMTLKKSSIQSNNIEFTFDVQKTIDLEWLEKQIKIFTKIMNKDL